MIKVTRFTASWCSPCRALSPIIEEVKKEIFDVEFETIDIDATPEVASKYGIMSIPVVVIEKDGKETDRFVGLQPKIKYVEAINKQKEKQQC